MIALAFTANTAAVGALALAAVVIGAWILKGKKNNPPSFN